MYVNLPIFRLLQHYDFAYFRCYTVHVVELTQLLYQLLHLYKHPTGTTKLISDYI